MKIQSLILATILSSSAVVETAGAAHKQETEKKTVTEKPKSSSSVAETAGAANKQETEKKTVTEKPKLAKKTEEIFSVPDFLKQDVDFWAKVYREWDTDQVVIYDSQSKVIYRVLTLPRVSYGLSSQSYRKEVQEATASVQNVLKKIIEGQTEDNEDPLFASIYDVVKKNGLQKNVDLVERMRQQSGLRTQFEAGLKISGRYAEDMKAVLKSQDLPDELLAIVFVESLFHIGAQSHAGASGPWGIMKETAINSGIHVNKFTDERVDPVLSTWGAARYLKKAKENLTEWPLAITSYNYGFPGMMRAVNNLGSTDFSVILAQHESPIFKYASKSYYAEFLAALDTLRNQDHYFPGVSKDDHWQYDVVQVRRPVAVSDLISVGAISKDNLARLNPSLTQRTIDGSEVIPSDYALRVPRNGSNQFYARLKKVPANKRTQAAQKISTKYHARGKETLYRIAKNFGVSVERFSERMGKAQDYRPKGPINIRSELYTFSPLMEINKNMLLSAGRLLEKPPEIGRR